MQQPHQNIALWFIDTYTTTKVFTRRRVRVNPKIYMAWNVHVKLIFILTHATLAPKCAQKSEFCNIWIWEYVAKLEQEMGKSMIK